MSAVITEVDEFTANVTVPTAGDPRNAASILPAFQALSNRTKNLLSRINSRLGVRALSAAAFRGCVSSGGVVEWILGENGGVFSKTDSGFAVCPLDGMLFNGATLSNVTVRVQPGAVRTGTNRVKVTVTKVALADNTSSIVGSSAYDSGSTSLQSVSIALAETIDVTAYAYKVVVVSGNDAGTNQDTIVGGSVTLA